MPKRQTVKRHATDEIQGEGSYVIVTGVKIGEIRKIKKLSEDPEYDQFEGGLEMVADHVREWNWVDDEGKPLPLPKDDPLVVDDLTNEETEYLAELLIGSVASKN